MAVILMKVGADPEWIFWDSDENVIVPASLFCGGAGDTAHAIGTDGHSVTAEMRPTPNKNVLMLLLDIATKLGVVETALADVNARGGRHITAVAQPYFADEPLGGHIHLSYWTDMDPSAHNVWRAAYQKVDPLIMPFYRETLWKRRLHRLGDDYTYREQPMPNPPAPPRVGWKAYRVEYRRPATWLVNPAMAYAYLGLAKLAMINWDNRRPPAALVAEGFHPYLTRFLEMSRTNVTPDLEDLAVAVRKSIAFVAETEPPYFIDFTAWRRVME